MAIKTPWSRLANDVRNSRDAAVYWRCVCGRVFGYCRGFGGSSRGAVTTLAGAMSPPLPERGRPPYLWGQVNEDAFCFFVRRVAICKRRVFVSGAVPPFFGADRHRLVVERPEMDVSPTLNNEVTTMKKLILATMLAVFAVTGHAQTVSEDISKVVESVVIDNLKQVAGSGAQNLSVSGQALSNSQSILFSNSTAHAARINAITEKALAQVLTTGAVEGATAISKVNQSDLPALMSSLAAIVATQKQNAQVVYIPTDVNATP